MSFVKFLGIGSSVPEKVLSNTDFEKMIDTSDEWIRSRTGIVERRIAAPEVASSDLAYEAALKALEDASMDPEDIDGIVVGTITPDFIFPSTACVLQSLLGAKNAFAFDVLAGCSGFIYALHVAKGMIQGGGSKNLLVVGAETISKIMNYEDRTTCILFGDGAGAAVITTSDTPGILSSCLGANGDGWEFLYMPAGGSRLPTSEESLKNGSHFLQMEGKEVFKEAVKALQSSSLEAIRLADITPDDIDLLIPHQANYRIIESVRKRLELPEEKVFSNLDKYGNTSSASVPIALDEAVKSGRLKRGDIVVFSAFGAGFTWGASVVRW
ncbi:MAG: ketoacyl-ACP synthase III [Deltaproteobacteria bacterium]|nr:ketoacyl-ACP synthase III [Deltaproteobacteria bacterium]MCK5709625.1 ketoacyl-ACP synthase III [Deltaproteobacteria bacterium]